MLLRSVAIYEILRCSAQHNLPRYRYLRILLKADGRFCLFPVVEYNCDARFGDSGLSALVDEILSFSMSASTHISLVLRCLFTCKFVARTVLIFVIPRTKHIESKMFDFPLPLRPVIELKLSSLEWCQCGARYRKSLFTHHPEMTVRTAYDLKPWDMIRCVVACIRSYTYVDNHFDYPHVGGAVSSRTVDFELSRKQSDPFGAIPVTLLVMASDHVQLSRTKKTSTSCESKTQTQPLQVYNTKYGNSSGASLGFGGDPQKTTTIFMGFPPKPPGSLRSN